VARKGIVDYGLDVQGVAAHAGVEPEKGRNAILEIANKIVALQALNGSVPGGIVNVGLLQGGTALNVVPDAATAGIQVRAPDPDGLAQLDALIRGVVAAAAVPGTSATLTVRKTVPPMARTAANERLAALAAAVAADLGFDLEAVATGGASDACVVAHAGIPVIDGLGPIGGDAHSPREWLALDSIVPRTALLAGLIARIAEG
jgi:glutamate carboxypeptidase